MLSVNAVAALESNYIWVIQPNPQEPWVYLVDPGDAAPVLDYLKLHQLRPAGILVTHRHHDHINGIAQLLAHWPVPVYGPKSPAITEVSHTLADGDQVSLPGITLNIIGVPGHTREHIAYLLRPQKSAASPSAPALFCGDALFAGGCGRMIDGPAEVMWDSLMRLCELPDDTLIYCAHEYTQANLSFARWVEPNNLALKQRVEQTKQMRAKGEITLPSNLLLEKQTNPFLRCQTAEVKQFVQQVSTKGQDVAHSNSEVFARLRQAKDDWKAP